MPTYLGNEDLARRVISYRSKIMLRSKLNRLRSKAVELLSELRTSFRPKRSTGEQIFNIRLLIEKHVDHHQYLDLYHNFIDFKKTFYRVLYNRLWRYTIDEGLVTLYDEGLVTLYDEGLVTLYDEGLVTLYDEGLVTLYDEGLVTLYDEGLVTLYDEGLVTLYDEGLVTLYDEGLVTLYDERTSDTI